MKNVRKPRKRKKTQQNKATFSAEKIRLKASELFYKGAIEEANKTLLSLFKQASYSKQVKNEQKIQDYDLCLRILYHLGHYSEALGYAKKLVELAPNASENWEHLGACYIHCKQFENAISALDKANQKAEFLNANIWSALADAFGKLNDLENAKNAGEQALQIKLQNLQHLTKYPIPTVPPTVFNLKTPEKNIISFSLFGENSKYCETACLNVQHAKIHYPAWKCRFYCDETVPINIRYRLVNSGAEVVIMATPVRISDGLFWRFLVMEDSKVDRFLIRDCDAIVNQREAKAVNDWLNSKKYFHLMRDSLNHTELILAGMFGGVPGLIPDIKQKIEKFQSKNHTIQTHLDQDFLRHEVWPSLSQSLCSHDSCFEFHHSNKFPPNSELAQGGNVGSGQYSHSINKTDKKEGTKVKWSLYENDGLICSYTVVVKDGCWVVTVPVEYEEKIISKQYRIKANFIRD